MASGNTKYQLAKWEFTSGQISALEGKRGVPCHMKFVIEDVKTGSPYSETPHVVARIIEIAERKP